MSSGTNGPSVYFDVHSSRRRAVTLVFGDRLEMELRRYPPCRCPFRHPPPELLDGALAGAA